MMIRKDRRGIAITKGQKKHKITFRDELDFQVSESEPFAPRTYASSTILSPKDSLVELGSKKYSMIEQSKESFVSNRS